MTRARSAGRTPGRKAARWWPRALACGCVWLAACAVEEEPAGSAAAPAPSGSPDSAAGAVGADVNAAAVGFAVTRLEFPGGPGSGQAHLAIVPGGSPILSWLEPDGEGHLLRFAEFDGERFGAPSVVAYGERLFVNWVDFPSVVPVTADHWVAHWLQRQPDSFGAYDAIVAVSGDGGRSWSAGVRLNDDETEAEHGFVEIFARDGAAHAFWLDGRELANWSFEAPDALLGVSLRAARILADGTVAGREIVDPLVCDCCQPDVAVAADGPVVVYRDRTAEEIRDVVVRRLDEGRWAEPVGVGAEGWYIEGCPVNGPAVAAEGNRVSVAWFTAAAGAASVRLALSADGGRSFGPALDVDTDGALGQVDVVAHADGASTVSWWRRGAAGGIDLAVRSVGSGGELGPIAIVASEAVSQPVDVPQMLAVGDGLLLAWTTFDDDGMVRAALTRRP